MIKHEIIVLLKELSKAINKHYGYVSVEGSNFGEPVINSGPCGPFANVFYHEWNKRFNEKVVICFVMETKIDECYHILIRLPNGQLYDGGTGLHDDSHYDKRFKIEDMEKYNFKLLDERSYGLDRTFPRFCPEFKIFDLVSMIEKYLDLIIKYY